MYYRIRHLTRYLYSAPVHESLTEVRMHPRTEGAQRCLDYQLAVTPKAPVHLYRDFSGNTVHHFSVPPPHEELKIMAESVVEMKDWPELPIFLSPSAWNELDRETARGDYWEYLLPSRFPQPTPLLIELARQINAVRRDDPLSVLREINSQLHYAFDYTPESTRVDSPIDDALKQRKGVCQDFAHVMIAIVRQLRIPCRYVSGYLCRGEKATDRSTDDASHAWVEAWLPGPGWVGFDPTNNLLAGTRHIRTAVGRDYSDVPPARGIYKGTASAVMGVAVHVTMSDDLPPEFAELVLPEEQSFPRDVLALDKNRVKTPPSWQLELLQRQQQQQQQQ
jgi:transglutaminase-like putative cysteine protease